MTLTVPETYFCHLDHTGRRRDIDQRPELTCGSVEFVATPVRIYICDVMCATFTPFSAILLAGAAGTFGHLRAGRFIRCRAIGCSYICCPRLQRRTTSRRFLDDMPF